MYKPGVLLCICASREAQPLVLRVDYSLQYPYTLSHSAEEDPISMLVLFNKRTCQVFQTKSRKIYRVRYSVCGNKIKYQSKLLDRARTLVHLAEVAHFIGILALLSNLFLISTIFSGNIKA